MPKIRFLQKPGDQMLGLDPESIVTSVTLIVVFTSGATQRNHCVTKGKTLSTALSALYSRVHMRLMTLTRRTESSSSLPTEI